MIALEPTVTPAPITVGKSPPNFATCTTAPSPIEEPSPICACAYVLSSSSSNSSVMVVTTGFCYHLCANAFLKAQQYNRQSNTQRRHSVVCKMTSRARCILWLTSYAHQRAEYKKYLRYAHRLIMFRAAYQQYTNLDVMHISSHNSAIPHTNALAQLNIANYARCRCYKALRCQGRVQSFVRQDPCSRFHCAVESQQVELNV
eukprot:13668-Heterococcus_DN1.PRE.3